jgi:hypothetical protein
MGRPPPAAVRNAVGCPSPIGLSAIPEGTQAD